MKPLDSQTSADVMQLLADLNQQGITLALVTHDADVAKQASRLIRVQDGAIQTGS
ncbi:MAG: hypothetical protein NW237_17820 [Cyanobacteriota bacterium]|nr:hypothetical protein [Cyanobacteriota bacterium]